MKEWSEREREQFKEYKKETIKEREGRIVKERSKERKRERQKEKMKETKKRKERKLFNTTKCMYPVWEYESVLVEEDCYKKNDYKCGSDKTKKRQRIKKKGNED